MRDYATGCKTGLTNQRERERALRAKEKELWVSMYYVKPVVPMVKTDVM